jgi:hypothetical protein
MWHPCCSYCLRTHHGSGLQKGRTHLRLYETNFANTIHLVRPDENLPLIIDIESIGTILSQQDYQENTNTVSTASRVLTPKEKRYKTCEKELLAIVLALEKFRITSADIR